jgi:cbb3-type cytochrome oxidase subunit 3
METQMKVALPPLLAWLDHYWIVPVTIVFVAVVVKYYWPNQKREQDRQASIPLDDDP